MRRCGVAGVAGVKWVTGAGWGVDGGRFGVGERGDGCCQWERGEGTEASARGGGD